MQGIIRRDATAHITFRKIQRRALLLALAESASRGKLARLRCMKRELIASAFPESVTAAAGRLRANHCARPTDHNWNGYVARPMRGHAAATQTPRRAKDPPFID
jgi:hypothetical protein